MAPVPLVPLAQPTHNAAVEPALEVPHVSPDRPAWHATGHACVATSMTCYLYLHKQEPEARW